MRSSTAESDSSSVYSVASSVSMALWAYIWSCNVFLCELVMTLPLSKIRVHEIGAGCALGAVTAASVGAHSVTASDAVTTAAAAVQHSVSKMASGRSIDYVMLDWADESARLKFSGSADLVLGSDVAYMAASVPDLAATALALLAPGGAGIIIDPCRLGADGLEKALVEEAGRCGNCSARCVTLRNTWSPHNAAVPELRIFLVFKHHTQANADDPKEKSEIQEAVDRAVNSYSQQRCCETLDQALAKAQVSASSHTLDIETRFV